MLATLPATRPSIFGRLADRLDPTSEASRMDRERDAAYADVQVFARHASLQLPDGSPVAFAKVGWGWQFGLLWLWAVTKLTVVLKARQLGVSWLAAIFAVWTAIRRPGQSVLLISRRQDDANKLLEKVAFVYERLPAWKPRAVINVTTISFPDLKSEIEALPATENIGRSRTANLVVLDEHAHQPFARKILLAVMAAAEHGKVLSISSANGRGALHTGLYEGAKKGQGRLGPTVSPKGEPLRMLVTRAVGPNGWRGVFIPFSAHPQRDAAWRADERAKLQDLSDAEFNQEHPADDVEAIRTTGSPIFDPARLDAQQMRRGVTIAGIAGSAEYVAPAPKCLYVIGADPAEGLVDSDWSSASVLRVWQEEGETYKAEQVATLRGRWPPEVFAKKLHDLACYYGRHADPETPKPVLLAWERNNHGHAVRVALEALETHGAPYNMFRAKDKLRGWLQTKETRAVLVDQLAAAIRTDVLALHDAETIEQFAFFHENERGKAEAQGDHHDDDVIAAGLAWQMRRRVFGRVLGLPQRPAKAAA